MAGEYIEFHNNAQPALNETNVNRMQQLIKQDIQGAVSGDTLPVGVIMPFGSDIIPENWLLCNGQAVSRTDYQQLFNTIGITFGQGDGFTTFNLPDLKGKVVIGKDGEDTDFNLIGKTGGEKEHTLTIAEMPSHKHNINYGGIARQPMVDTGINDTEWGVKFSTVGGYRANAGEMINNGGGQAHNILQPYQVQNYIIKAKQSAGVVATVVDDLDSTSTTDALSANQGKILNDKTTLKYCIATTTTASNLESNFQVLLNSIADRIGTELFSLSNNMVKIGTGVSKVRVSGGIFVEAPQNTGYVWGRIVKKRGNSEWNVNTIIVPYNNGGGFLSVSIPPMITDVTAGDEFKLIADSTCQGNLRVGVANTWIMIEVVE